MLTNAVVLGGLGQAGMLLAESLQNSGIPVTLVDAREPDDRQFDGPAFLKSDVGECGPDLRSLLASSDCVCVCLPEKVALRAASHLAAAMREGSLWVDTLSVKTDIVGLIERYAGTLEVLSINPMFAPVMGWRGGSVAAVEPVPGPKTAFFKGLLCTWGARVEKISAQEHDRLTGMIQVATHAAVYCFGAATLQSGFDLEKALRLATPPFRVLLTLLYRMTTQSPDVYWDIQAHHPLARSVRQGLLRTLEDLQHDATKDNSAKFKATIEHLKLLFEAQAGTFSQWAVQALTLPPGKNLSSQ
jgi:4-amino-4-deoxyprephenate dehydrogenase